MSSDPRRRRPPHALADKGRVNLDCFALVIRSVKRDIFDHALDDRMQSARANVLGRRVHGRSQVSHLSQGVVLELSSTPSVASIATLCLVSAFWGSVRMA